MNKHRTTRWLSLAFVALFALVGGTAHAAKGLIKIAENDWTGNHVNVWLSKIILEEELDYEVELVFASFTATWPAIAAGDMHVAMDFPLSYSIDAIAEFVTEKKQVELVGPNGVANQARLYVPTYLIEGDSERGIEPLGADLADYRNLNKYKSAFARPESGDLGFLLDNVPEWNNQTEERIAAFGWKFKTFYSGSDAASIAELKSAYAKGEPILFHLWEPHWIHAEYDLTALDLPPYSDECYGLAEGTEATFACQWPTDPGNTIVRTGFKGEFPDAYAFFEKFTLTNAQYADMQGAVELNGQAAEQAVRDWMAANESVWRGWLP